MPQLRMHALALSAIILTAISVPAQEAKTQDTQDITRFIDSAIDRHLRDAKLTATPRCDDTEFLRRAYLDITGRIPTAEQAARFLASTEPNKRGQLIDELLASPNYGEHLGRVWRDWIAPAELPSEGNGGNQPIQATQNFGKWLGQRFNAGDGWDQIVGKILTVEGTLKEQPQGLFFSLVGDDQGRPLPAGAARAVSSLFMGVQLQCAECHNDPFKDWKQTDFWGTAAFFRNITWKFNGRYFDTIGEAADPVAAAMAIKKGNKPTDPSPNGAIAIPKEAFKNVGQVIPARLVGSAEPYAKTDQPLRPAFAAWLTARDNPYLARAFVNRTWSYFFTRGFVYPLDDFRDDNPATHPEVLQRLTAEFVAADLDVRHLIRCIANTEAYQRSSRPGKDKQAVAVAQFARMPVKVMSADMLYDSLKLALTDPALDLRTYDAKEAGRFGESSPVGSAYDEFVKSFTTNEDDATEFTHGIPQFLALINHPRLRTGGKTVDDLIKRNLSVEQAVETLYLATLSRPPTAEELAESKQFVGQAADVRKGQAGVLWMLINRSEFLLVR